MRLTEYFCILSLGLEMERPYSRSAKFPHCSDSKQKKV